MMPHRNTNPLINIAQFIKLTGGLTYLQNIPESGGM
jgi:hypothetical protein